MLRKCSSFSAFIDKLERRRCGRLTTKLGSTAADAIGICLFVPARVVGSVTLGFSRSSGSVCQTSKRFDGGTELVVADVGLSKFAVIAAARRCVGWGEFLV